MISTENHAAENALVTVAKNRNSEKTSRKRKDTRQPFSVIQTRTDNLEIMVGRDNKNKRQKTVHDEREDVRSNVNDGEMDKNLSSSKEIQSELELGKKCASQSVAISGEEVELARQEFNIFYIEHENLKFNKTVKKAEAEISELQKKVNGFKLLQELCVALCTKETTRENFDERVELIEKLMKELYSRVTDGSEKMKDSVTQLVTYFDVNFDCVRSTDNSKFIVVLSSKNLDPAIEKKFEVCWDNLEQRVDIENGSKTTSETRDDNLEKTKNVLSDENKVEKKKLSQRELELKYYEFLNKNKTLWDKINALNAERDDLQESVCLAECLEEAVNEEFEERANVHTVVDGGDILFILKTLVKELLTDRNEIAEEDVRVVVDDNDDDLEKEFRSRADFVMSLAYHR